MGLRHAFLLYSRGHANLLLRLGVGFICGSVSTASLWASLAEGQPLVRVVIVTTLAAGLGLIAGYAFTGRENVMAWLFLSWISTVIAAVINVSLLLIRVARFRVVSRARICREA